MRDLLRVNVQLGTIDSRTSLRLSVSCFRDQPGISRSSHPRKQGRGPSRTCRAPRARRTSWQNAAENRRESRLASFATVGVFLAIWVHSGELWHAEAAHVHQTGRVIDDKRQRHAQTRQLTLNWRPLRGEPQRRETESRGGELQELASIMHDGSLCGMISSAADRQRSFVNDF